MRYDFDTVAARRGTNCLKYDFAAENGKPEGLIPLWVADMDFKAPVEVTESLKRCVEHGIFGYTDVKRSYYDALQEWFLKYFNWNTQSDWIVKAPGVVFALAAAVRAFSAEGEGVMIQQPVYHPFENVVKVNHRRLVVNPLICEDGVYRMDLAEFERKLEEENVKLFLLCSPHNPVGRVWSMEELVQVGRICRAHHVLVVSDEIHCDFTYPGYSHTVFATVSEEDAQNSIICTAPSKTFNLAGLQASNIWIPNAALRETFKKEIARTGYSDLNSMGLAAGQAAYQYGGQWLLELKEYLAVNKEFVNEFLTENLPAIHLIQPQGTYLLWLDFRDMGLQNEELNRLLTDQAHLWLVDGNAFGKGGNGYQRMNIACPKIILERAMAQLKEAFK